MAVTGRASSRRPLRWFLTSTVVAIAAAACAPIAPIAPPPFYAANPPVFNVNFPDPAVLSIGDGTFRAYSTNAIYGWLDWPRVPAARADTLGGPWTRGNPTDALPEPFPATWQRTPANDYRHFFWAPTVHQFGSAWVMYYTAPNASSPDQCIGVATADSMAGPYQPVGSGPFVCDFGSGGSIDPSVVVDTGGQAWLLWKNDGNCCNLPVYIWSAPLAPDGLALAGNPRAILGVDQTWEDGSNLGREPWKRLVEGPAMVEVEGVYWLFYSGNWWDSARYATGYAICTSPGGGCAKQTNRPLLGNGPHGSGPGGPSVVTDQAGQRWLAYHAWNPCCVGTSSTGWRSLRISRLDITNGFPVLGASP
jgi:Glycosyl hydrolases family 43